MKIGRNRSGRAGTSRWMWMLAVLFAFALGSALGARGLYQTLPVYWQSISSKLGASTDNIVLPSLIVDMDFASYENILAQRQEALDNGVFLAEEVDFNPATIRLVDREIPVRIRVAQGPAQHLGEDDKWNFDFRTRDNQLFQGMSRFRLIDPADNNWLAEWAFQRNLAREGILSTNYLFVQLIFNGDDRGIYAVQEGFDWRLSQTERPEGVIVEFDGTRLWESMAYFGGNALDATYDPVTNLSARDFQYFEIDTFRDAAIANDEILSAQKDAAIGLLQGLQSGELAAAEVFDVQQYGRFLALVDLWGATDGTALVNLRYYYNPDNGHLQPIGFNGNPLRQQRQESDRLSLDATYHDPDLQVAYVQAAQRFSQPDYLDELRAEFDAELTRLQQALSTEVTFPLPWEALQQRQQQMQRSLNPLEPVFSLLGSPTLAMSATLEIDVANVLNIPVEILGFDIGGATFLEAKAAWIVNDPAGLLVASEENIVMRARDNDQADALRYIRFHIPLSEIIQVDRELDSMRVPEIQVATRLLGLERRMLTPARQLQP